MSIRSIMNAALNFGLVSMGVKVYGATEEHDISFKWAHAHADGVIGRVGQKKICSHCKEEVPFAEVAKGYDPGDGNLVVITDEDLATIPLETKDRIQLTEFVSADSIDPILREKVYYLAPDKTATTAYALLRDALTQAGKVGIAKVTMRQRERLVMIGVRDGVVTLTTLRWADEVRAADVSTLTLLPESKPAELAMALKLVEGMTTEFDPSKYTDDYEVALRAKVEAKLTAQPVTVQTEQPNNVASLMEALRQSVERNKAKREEAATPTVKRPRQTRRKVAA